MRKLFAALTIVLLISFPLSLNVQAADVTQINDLIEKAKELDGQEVTVQGEVIGEHMDRGEYSWININDGTNAIGIWLSKNEKEKISFYGSYKFTGDTVKITGIFNRACKEHGGEADLHINKSIEILNSGHIVKEDISSSKIIVTLILTSIALFFLFCFLKRYYFKDNL